MLRRSRWRRHVDVGGQLGSRGLLTLPLARHDGLLVVGRFLEQGSGVSLGRQKHHLGSSLLQERLEHLLVLVVELSLSLQLVCAREG